MRILLVGYENAIALSIKKSLERSGYFLFATDTLDEAELLIDNVRPAIILLNFDFTTQNSASTWILDQKKHEHQFPPLILTVFDPEVKFIDPAIRLAVRELVVYDTFMLDKLPEIVKRVSFELKTEEKLIKAEQKIDNIADYYQSIIENAPDGIVVLDSKFQFKFLSNSALKILGYQEGDVNILKSAEVTYDQDLPLVISALKKLSADHEQKTITLEYRALHRSGNWIWIESTFTNMLENPNLEGIVINFRDITEKRKAQHELRHSLNILNMLLEKSSIFIDSGVDEPDYQEITNVMMKITGARYISFNVFDDNGVDYRTKALCGLPDFVNVSMRYLGFTLQNKKWNHDPARIEMSTKNSVIYYKNFLELVGNTIPFSLAQRIEKHFMLNEYVVLSVKRNFNLLGDFVLLFTKGHTLENLNIAKLYANLVGQYLVRRKTEMKLNNHMEDMLRFQRLTVDRELNMINLKKEVNALLERLGEGKKYIIVGE